MAPQRETSTETTEETQRFIACYLEDQQKARRTPTHNTAIMYQGHEPDCSQFLNQIASNYRGGQVALVRNLIFKEEKVARTEPLIHFVGDPYREKSNQYRIGWPESFLQEIEDLRDLAFGWDGGKEIPPSEAILSRALQIVHDVLECCEKLGKAPIFPETAPGFRGELGLEYVQNDKSLCIEVSPFPRDPTVLIFSVTKDKNGEIDLKSHDHIELLSVVRWLFEDSNI